MKLGIVWPVFSLRLLQLVLILSMIPLVWVTVQLPFIVTPWVGVILVCSVAAGATSALVFVGAINDHINERI